MRHPHARDRVARLRIQAKLLTIDKKVERLLDSEFESLSYQEEKMLRYVLARIKELESNVDV